MEPSAEYRSAYRADYRDLLTQAYDLDKPAAPADELAFHRGVIGSAEPVLELMCGSGRFLLPLLAAGVDVDGVDASASMLDACRAHARDRGLDVTGRLQEQRTEDLSLRRRYRAAFCAAGSWGLLAGDDEVGRALAAVRVHLLPGGTFHFEVETGPGPPGAPGGTNWWTRPDGAVITLRGGTRIDPTTGVEHGVGIYELFVDGVLVHTELNRWVRRFWPADAIAAAVRDAGFSEVVVRSGHSDEHPGPDDLLLTVHATR
ncbi:class I SAM-dependent DNA methyltransferase [Pseudonocardia sp. RS010]|uniref:class I SAM-dependent DNA methyltransferase n=1 Tax=Pseudonocardia sp. RS010 TaxID=3385979 RepID=UPI0039A39EC7